MGLFQRPEGFYECRTSSPYQCRTTAKRIFLPRGAITEVVGSGKTEFMVEFLQKNSSLRAVWIEQELTINPVAIAQRGVNIERILFVQAEKDFVWGIEESVRSGIFPIVLATNVYPEEKPLRRLQLNAEKAKCALVFLNDFPSGMWPISLSLKINQGKVETLRSRV